MPKKIHDFYRKAKISKMSLNKGGNFLSREPVFIRRGKEIVLVRGVNLS